MDNVPPFEGGDCEFDPSRCVFTMTSLHSISFHFPFFCLRFDTQNGKCVLCLLKLCSEMIEFLLIVESGICSIKQSNNFCLYSYWMDRKSELKSMNGNNNLMNENEQLEYFRAFYFYGA
jgi:hypothetical protein